MSSCLCCDGMQLADIPVAGEFLEDILGRPGPPIQLGQPVPPFNVAPAPPIITTLPFGIGEDDQDNKDYQDDQVVQSVKTEMVHKESVRVHVSCYLPLVRYLMLRDD